MHRIDKRKLSFLALEKEKRSTTGIGIVLLCFLFVLPGWTQTPAQKAALLSAQSRQQSSAAASSLDSDPVSVEEKLVRAKAEMALLIADGGLTNAPAGITLEETAVRRALAHRLVWLLEQQISNAQQQEEASKRREAVAEESRNWTRFSESPPYSILLVDKLREELQSETLKSASEEATVGTIDLLAAENRATVKESEERIRQLNERLEGGTDPLAQARLEWQRDLERLRSRVSAASLAVLESERRLRTELGLESTLRTELLKRKLIIAEAGATFTQADLDVVRSRIDRATAQLQAELQEAFKRLQQSTNELNAARAALSSQQAPVNNTESSAVALASVDQERVAALETETDTAEASIRALRLLQELESVELTMWQMRYGLQSTRKVSGIRDSEQRLHQFERRLALWMEYPRHELLISANKIEMEEERLRSLPPTSPIVTNAKAKLSALREKDQLLQRISRRITQLQRLSQRWAEELRTAESHLPLTGRVQNLFSDTGSFLNKMWSFELFTAEDTIEVEGQKITGKRSVTLGKIIMAVGIFVVGIWMIGFVTRIAEPVIVRRLKMELNQARLVRRWMQAFAVLCLTMFSLLSVKIPLTVFAFAGGALAIGLGFGMQTLLKNFVSGLILLFERPFRVGDVVEVSGQRGTVTEIGLRSSVLQLWDGTETLIPNSSLLENNVSNWTYSNRKVRFHVTVGAAYGSDVRKIIKLLEEVAARHGVIEKHPTPQVLFTEFADSALTFELRYWVDVIANNSAQIASDLRQMIASSFGENGISIAFPQRDIHLDVKGAVPVTITHQQSGLIGDPEHAKPKESL